MLLPQPFTIQPISHALLAEKGVKLAVMRLDQIHAAVSGNKFFKLKYNLEAAKESGKSTVLTFGGAFSNHIYATASAARSEGLQSIGVIRGKDVDLENPTLRHAQKMGMKLHLVDRDSYRKKDSPEFLDLLKKEFGDFYLVPEGGTNALAIRGTSEILGKEHSEFSHVCVSIGTGGTFAGLASAMENHQTLLGFSSLKGDFIHGEINALLEKHEIKPRGELAIRSDYHFGGYAKTKPELIAFMTWFYAEFGVPLDPIYTGKLAFGLWDLVGKGHFPKNSHILMIHTGGLQGNAGFAEKTGIELPRT
ncbi:pyridoxal-phosphate dependent enzyme [Algoriphagus sp. H41]|uniref:Pyridoxal-phosphate dependent enzyme n=1 Tax=Algoriphagus oliviformis TaxID=2811231 RepID=A0ABS3BXF6_9BACT|nr:pyridoxal-phosphate dependent enzyme [Algoriphagus oliviformis]MBN7809547.1 pyridoxal-phosphate dependent enzyme [Algoriphagus oliviformis]